jgi:hypothetical protein
VGWSHEAAAAGSEQTFTSAFLSQEAPMADTSRIREHMEVVGSDGQHVGTVDGVEGGNQIKLTRSDPSAGGEHHFISADLVSEVGDRVRLSRPADEVRRTWRSAGDAGMR